MTDEAAGNDPHEDLPPADPVRLDFADRDATHIPTDTVDSNPVSLSGIAPMSAVPASTAPASTAPASIGPTSARAVTLESPALYAHVVMNLLTKGYCKFDGLGGFHIERTRRSTKLTFVASQVLKSAIRRPSAIDSHEPLPVSEERQAVASAALDRALPAGKEEPSLLPFVLYETQDCHEPLLVRFVDLAQGEPETRLADARQFIETLGSKASRYSLVYSAELRRNYGVAHDAVIAEVASAGDTFALVYSRCYGQTETEAGVEAEPKAPQTQCIGTTPNLLVPIPEAAIADKTNVEEIRASD